MAIREECALVAPEFSSGQSPSKPSAPNFVSNESDHQRKATKHRRSLLRRALAAGCLGAVVSMATGCTMYSSATRAVCDYECLNDFMISHRHRVMAARAWHREKACIRDHCFADEVKRGFMDAYMDVAGGGTGCVPAIAPREYWGWRYQSANGRGAVNAWFEGYPLGAKAAEQDGVGNHQTVQMANFRQPAESPVNLPGMEEIPAGNPSGELVPVPGGFINASGDLIDHNGRIIGKGTVEDRAVGEPSEAAESSSDREAGSLQEIPPMDTPPAPSVVEPADPESTAPVAPTDDTFSKAQDVSSGTTLSGTSDGAKQDEPFTANFSDQTIESGSTAIDSTVYRLDEPSKEDIDAVIDDIFGKPQSEPSSDEQDTNTFQSIPFTFE